MSKPRVTCREFILAAIRHFRRGKASGVTPFAVAVWRIANAASELFTKGHIIKTLNDLISNGTIILFSKEKIKGFPVRKVCLSHVEKDVDLTRWSWEFNKNGKYYDWLEERDSTQFHRSLSYPVIVISADGYPKKYDDYVPKKLAYTPVVQAVLDSML